MKLKHLWNMGRLLVCILLNHASFLQIYIYRFIERAYSIDRDDYDEFNQKEITCLFKLCNCAISKRTPF